MSVEDIVGALGDKADRIFNKFTEVVTDRKTNEWLDRKPATESQHNGTPEKNGNSKLVREDQQAGIPDTNPTSQPVGENQHASTSNASAADMSLGESQQTDAPATNASNKSVAKPIAGLRKHIGIIAIITCLLVGSTLSFLYNPIPTDKKFEIISIYVANEKVNFRVPTTKENGYREIAAFNVDSALKTNDSSKQKNLKKLVSIETPAARMYNIILDNNTRLYLDASSSISFYWPFDEKDKTITLEKGQAGLDVESDKERSFIIQSKNLTATAGTALFNFSTYDKEEEKISVLTGKVSLPGQAKGPNRLSSLVANQEACWLMQDKKIGVRKFDGQELISWYLDGRRYFKEVTIDEISQAAQRWYGITILVDPNMPDTRFTGYLDRRLSFSKFLELLEDKHNIVSKELEPGKVFITKRK